MKVHGSISCLACTILDTFYIACMNDRVYAIQLGLIISGYEPPQGDPWKPSKDVSSTRRDSHETDKEPGQMVLIRLTRSISLDEYSYYMSREDSLQ